MGTGESRRAHPGVGQGACEAAIPGSASWKRRVGRPGGRCATSGPRVRALSRGIAPGAKEAWRDSSGRLPPSVPRSRAASAQLPKLTFAGPAPSRTSGPQAPHLGALCRRPTRRKPRLTAAWAAPPDRASENASLFPPRHVPTPAFSLAGHRGVPPLPRPTPAEPSVSHQPSRLSASRGLGSASRWAAAPAIPAPLAQLGVRLVLL